METSSAEGETTIVVFQDEAMEANGNMMTEIQFSTDDSGCNRCSTDVTNPEKDNETFLVPETFISQNSILGKDFVIRCAPCNKIFISADGYNNHVQVYKVKNGEQNFKSTEKYFISLTICLVKNIVHTNIILQNKECADDNNTALLAEVQQENIHELYATNDDTSTSHAHEKSTGNHTLNF